MAFWDIFKRKKTTAAKRSFTGTSNSRLFADWLANDTSPDDTLKNLTVMRNRTRDLARNNPTVQRYFQVLKQGVIGNQQGFKIQIHSRDSDGSLDDFANDIIERRWYQFCENPEVSGRYTMPDLYNMIVEGLIRDGEILVQCLYTPEGLRLSFLEPDYLDALLDKDLKNGRQIKMGVEVDKRTQKPLGYWLTDQPYANTSMGPDTQLKRSTFVPAEEMLHLFEPTRFGQTRG